LSDKTGALTTTSQGAGVHPVAEKKITAEELGKEVRYLHLLLEDCHPGLFTWREQFEEKATKVKEMLIGLGY